AFVAFRGHGFSLLALAKGMSTLFAKNGFSRPSLKYCGVFRHVLFPQMFSVGRVIAVPGQERLRQLLHRTKKIALYFRGVNGPPLQTTIVKWKRSEEHTSELQSRFDLVCRLLLEKKKKKRQTAIP